MRRLSSFALLSVSISIPGLAACVAGASGTSTTGPAVAPPEDPGTGPVADACPQEMGADAPDTADGAPPLDVGTHQGCYGLNDARDSFALAAPAHQGPVLYQLRVSGPGQGCLTAIGADGAVFKGLDTCADGPGATMEGWTLVMGGSAFTLQTRDLSGNAPTTANPYTLEIQATPLADPGEPDSREAPVPLELGQPTSAFLANAGNVKDLDHDYFAVTVPKDMRKKTRFQVAIDDVPSEVHMVLRVLDDKGRVLHEGAGANPGAAVAAEVKMKGPGTYLFHLRSLSGDNQTIGGKGAPPARAVKPYRITVSVP